MKKFLTVVGAIVLIAGLCWFGWDAVNNPALSSLASVVSSEKTDVSTPKHYQTERPVQFAIVSQKHTDVDTLNSSNLQAATLSLFNNLKADQHYENIIVILDPSYPANESDLFQQQAQFAFPNAKYSTILTTTADNETTLLAKLNQSFTSSTLVIVHSYLNFSDYDKNLLEIQKAQYKNSFDNLSKHALDNIAFTNKVGLKATYQLAKDHGFLKALPTFEDNAHQFQIKYLVSGQPFQTNIATVTFFGDMMLGRTVRTLMDKNNDLNYPFNLMDQSYLQINDLLVANLEGPIANKAVQTTKSIAFRFLPDIAPVLKSNHFDALSTANNHAIDMGQQGWLDGIENLKNIGIVPFGNPRGLGDETVSMFDLNGQKIALMGLNHTDFKLNKDDVVNKIKELKKQGYKVIPFLHWGVEYVHTPSSEQKELAHAFADAGAYAVVGMHPHVVETFEIYKDVPIFYSLGNAIFDQYFSPDTQEGLSATLRISPDQLEIYFVPFKIDRSQFYIMQGDKKNEFLKRLISWGTYDQEIKDQIEEGKIVIKFNEN